MDLRTAKEKSSSDILIKQRPATNPDARENQLIALAVDLVEERLRKGTASSAETVHFLKMGSTKERLAREKEEEEIKLLKAKTEAIQSAKQVEELYKEALTAMRTYSGNNGDEPI